MADISKPVGWIDASIKRLAAAQQRCGLSEIGPSPAVRQARLEKALLEAGVGRHHLALLTGDQILGETTSLKAVRTFAGDKSQWCLVLAGSRGVGKSLAACWLLARRLEGEGLSAVTHRHVFSSLHVMRARRDEQLLQTMLDAKLLILDDLGVEIPDQAGLFMWCLFEVINHRWANRKQTIVTTNVPPRELDIRYGQRVTDRLRDGGRCVITRGHSLRCNHPGS